LNPERTGRCACDYAVDARHVDPALGEKFPQPGAVFGVKDECLAHDAALEQREQERRRTPAAPDKCLRDARRRRRPFEIDVADRAELAREERIGRAWSR
jgi:hypothetical protein